MVASGWNCVSQIAQEYVDRLSCVCNTDPYTLVRDDPYKEGRISASGTGVDECLRGDGGRLIREVVEVICAVTRCCTEEADVGDIEVKVDFGDGDE